MEEKLEICMRALLSFSSHDGPGRIVAGDEFYASARAAALYEGNNPKLAVRMDAGEERTIRVAEPHKPSEFKPDAPRAAKAQRARKAKKGNAKGPSKRRR